MNDSVRDPVCGMAVDPATAKFHAEQDGHAVHFCSSKCQAKFLADPMRYPTPAPAMPPAGTRYTCPMHPQIVRDAPGNCPICGMTLKPMSASTVAAANASIVAPAAAVGDIESLSRVSVEQGQDQFPPPPRHGRGAAAA